jgi:hypothetical protein
MASKQRTKYVTVQGITYSPDDTIPAEVAKAIDNDSLYDEQSDMTPAEQVAQKLSDQARDSDQSKSGSKSS